MEVPEGFKPTINGLQPFAFIQFWLRNHIKNTLGGMRDYPSALVLGYSKSQTLAFSQFVLCPLQYPMYLMVRSPGLEPGVPCL